MSLWEYKVITSGKGGFATPALLEKFLNDLGKEEWEIIHFQPQPDNALVFTGLARRSTQRDWTLQDAAAAAAKTEAEKLRAEFEAKFKGATAANAAAAGADEKPETVAGEKLASDDGFRRVRDTERDLDPEAEDEEPKDEWDMLTSEDELPTFFEAIRPHLRRNQRGPGMSVGVEHLAKKWDLSDADIKGALVECGFVIPDDEDSAPAYLEYEGDLYWLNINRRGELWLNTKEKPRQVFRTVQAQKVAPETADEAKPESGADKPRGRDRKPESSAGEAGPAASDQSPIREPQSAIPSAPLPQGMELLEKIRPLMRRNRRGPGGSGSTSFLSRALKCSEADLMTAFASLGLVLPSAPTDEPVLVELGAEVWWLNQDQRGGIWINGRERSDGAAAPAAGAASGEMPAAKTETPAAVAPAPGHVLAAVRLLLKETKTGSVAGKTERLAEQLGKSPEDFLGALTGAGLAVPGKARDKPVFVEHAGEIFWLNRNAKDELWLNAKASKFASGDEGSEGEKKPGRASRPKKKSG